MVMNGIPSESTAWCWASFHLGDYLVVGEQGEKHCSNLSTLSQAATRFIAVAAFHGSWSFTFSQVRSMIQLTMARELEAQAATSTNTMESSTKEQPQQSRQPDPISPSVVFSGSNSHNGGVTPNESSTVRGPAGVISLPSATPSALPMQVLSNNIAALRGDTAAATADGRLRPSSSRGALQAGIPMTVSIFTTASGTSPTSSSVQAPPPPPPLTRQQQFLTFVKILLKHLEKTDNMALQKRTKSVLSDCIRKNRRGDPDFTPLHVAAEARILPVVGPRHWNRSLDYLNLYMRKQQQGIIIGGRKPPSAAGAALGDTVTMAVAI